MTIDIAEYHEELFQEVHSLADAEGRFAEDAFFDVLTAPLIDAGEIETADRVHHVSPRGIRVDGYGGDPVNRKRVRRLMQLIGLEAIYRRPNTSKPNPGHKVYPYLLRGLEINRVNQVWATDITYIPMARGLLYLVAIMDWHSRYVLAWRLSNTLEVDFCVAALEEALSKGRPQIFNTDQGSQFTSEAFTSMLLAQGVQVSMDGRGRCMDNVFVERLWRSIKYEEVYLKAYQNGTEARKGIGAYLAFYNQERPHQALGYRSPGQVFQAVSPQRCLLEHPQALPSDEGLRDTPSGRLSYFSLTAVLMMGST